MLTGVRDATASEISPPPETFPLVAALRHAYVMRTCDRNAFSRTADQQAGRGYGVRVLEQGFGGIASMKDRSIQRLSLWLLMLLSFYVAFAGYV